MELAELEGLRSFIPVLDQQVAQAVESVQHKNQLLQEQSMQRIRLEQHVEQLYGPDALGATGAATPPYTTELLRALAREYEEVQKLRQEVRQREAPRHATSRRRRRRISVCRCSVQRGCA
jgi:hypothetical protein